MVILESDQDVIDSICHDAKIQQACSSIRKNNGVKLKQLASEAGMAPAHFHRVFKRMMGCTPKQYGQRTTQPGLSSSNGSSRIIPKSRDEVDIGPLDFQPMRSEILEELDYSLNLCMGPGSMDLQEMGLSFLPPPSDENLNDMDMDLLLLDWEQVEATLAA
jgi:hypothetical protein